MNDDRIGTDEDFRELIAKGFFVDELPAKPPAVKRRSRAMSAEFKALRAIVRGFETLQGLGDNNLLAALNYIEDRYGKMIRRRW